MHTISRVAVATAALCLALAACSSSDGAEPGSSTSETTEETTEETLVGNEPSVSATEFTDAEVSDIQIAASPFYASVAPERIVVTGSRTVGQSDCQLITTFPGNPEFDSPLHLIRTASGELLVQELAPFNDVMQTCFYASGVEPTADDVAHLVTSMTSHLLSMTVRDEMPADVAASLGDKVLDEGLLDFDNYSGPVTVDVNGVGTVRFLAEDRLVNWYLVDAIASPDGSEVLSVSVIYVG